MDRIDVFKASEVVVGDSNLLDKKIAAIRKAGPQNLQVFFRFIFSPFFFSFSLT